MPATPVVHGPSPSPRQKAWHRREIYGFVHYTVNAFTDREWGYGDEAESVFAPTALDCRQWADAARQGGLTALILTAKHHDGFCLWPTATTSHHVGNSPLGAQADLVRDLAAACRETGLGFGVYCSPWDRNQARYGFPDYVDTFHAQWKELLTGYGELCELWFDGANGGDGFYGGAREKRSIDPTTYYRYDELWRLCRQLQPNASIFSDVGPDVRWCGNESGFTATTLWSRVRTDSSMPGRVESMDRLAAGDADGDIWRPVEVDVSIRPGWFFHPTEQPRSADELFDIYMASVGRGAGLNLNITPDRRGLIPHEDVQVLRRFRQRLEALTALDLVRGRPVEVDGPGVGDPRALTDGDRDTWWQAAGNTVTVTIPLGGYCRIGAIRLEEAIDFGQRVEAFSVDIHRWLNWIEIARGTTIGAQRILPLAPALGDSIRVRILASQAPAVLSRIMVYAP